MLSKSKKYGENGIFISSESVSVGDEVILGYNGLLATSGAKQVYAHVGYGDEWEEKEYIPMMYSDGMFKAVLKVNKSGILNVAFKDPINNWDNNSSQNYSFKVKSTTKTASTKTGVTKTKANAKKTGVKKSKTTKKK